MPSCIHLPLSSGHVFYKTTSDAQVFFSLAKKKEKKKVKKSIRNLFHQSTDMQVWIFGHLCVTVVKLAYIKEKIEKKKCLRYQKGQQCNYCIAVK